MCYRSSTVRERSGFATHFAGMAERLFAVFAVRIGRVILSRPLSVYIEQLLRCEFARGEVLESVTY